MLWGLGYDTVAVCMLLGRHFGFVLLGCDGGFRYYLMVVGGCGSGELRLIRSY